MALSYTEELVCEYYKHLMDEEGNPKYFVSEHVHYQEERGKKRVRGWHDIDVLAIGKEEVCIIQTKSYAIFENTVDESIREAIRTFGYQERFVRERYDVSGKKLRKIFIADLGLSNKFDDEFKKTNIEPRKLSDVVKEFFQILHKLYPDKYHVGKEENNVTRTLIFLTYTFGKDFNKIGLL